MQQTEWCLTSRMCIFIMEQQPRRRLPFLTPTSPAPPAPDLLKLDRDGGPGDSELAEAQEPGGWAPALPRAAASVHELECAEVSRGERKERADRRVPLRLREREPRCDAP